MKRLSEFKNYMIDTEGRVYNEAGHMMTPHWSKRDKLLYVQLRKDKTNHLRSLSSLMQQTYFPLTEQKENGYYLLPINADFRNLCLDNLTAIPRGRAIVLKKKLLGETRYDDFYTHFMKTPNIHEFHKLPIDVQHYIKERANIEWETKTSGYQMKRTYK